MFILFSLIVMRMSGAIAFNPVFGRTNIPSAAKGALVFVLSLMLYVGFDGTLVQEPRTMLEYGFMLVKELLFGFILGFGMELVFLIVRFASAVMDFSMGLSMAQIYDPQYNTQMTITSGIYYGFLVMLFFALDGHVHLIGLFYDSAQRIPFGGVSLKPELVQAVLGIFGDCIVMGMQLSFPLVAMELVSEAAVGIVMRIIPQINVFVLNFQLKIIVGLFMLLFLFNPMADKLYHALDYMFESLQQLIMLMG